MGNRIARAGAPQGTVYFDMPATETTSLPYRPAVDSFKRPLKLCTQFACAPSEVWWEEAYQSSYDGCQNRENTDGEQSAEMATAYHTCSKVDVGDCPILAGKVQAVSAEATNPKSYDGRRIRCHYSTDQVANKCQAATEFAQRKKRGDNIPEYENWFDADTMNALCSTRAEPSSCPKNPAGDSEKDGNGPICGEMIACPLCKSWALSNWAGAETQSDNIMQKWCDAHPKDPSCQCVKRMDDPLYRQIQASLKDLPLAGCWWKGCMDKKMEYDLVQSADRSAKECPKVYCANIIEITGGEVDIGKVNMSIQCDGEGIQCKPKCGTHGACTVSPNGGTVCKCEAGWKGVDCTVPDVAPPPDHMCTFDCGAHGQCSFDLDGDQTCACHDGWEGVSCDKQKNLPPTPPPPPVSPKDLKRMALTAAAAGLAVAGVLVLASTIVGPRRSPKISTMP